MSPRGPSLKRFPLNMRTTEEVRKALEKAARQSGRSLAQEVEFRLERSFRDDRVLFELDQIKTFVLHLLNRTAA